VKRGSVHPAKSVVVEKFRKLERGRIADQIVEDLRRQILQGALPDGTRLPAERELAERYRVSGATIREAVCALAAVGLVDIRHGSGTYVTATGEAMIAASISSVVQLEQVGADEVLGVLAILTAHAAELATRLASDDEIAALRQAAENLADIARVDETAANLKTFLHQLSAISHNPLLSALCKSLVELQVELALSLLGRQIAPWKKVAGALYADRILVVEAIEARDPVRAVALVRAYHDRTRALIASLPRAKTIMSSDPRLIKLVCSLIASPASSTDVFGA
jgi:GntR family transcriptional regulator, transcriptional repressor for pyruvate dehydrogenase complex